MQIPLEPDTHYHIYGHSNGRDDLFHVKENYLFFLERYERYVSPIAETFSYCLLPNHYHFLIRVFETEKLEPFLKMGSRGKDVSTLLSRQFSHFFNGYTQALNKQQGRSGNLFERPFRRKKINSDEYMRQLVMYINCNPVKHGFAEHAGQWPYTSYNAIIANERRSLVSRGAIDWFEDLDNFIYCHNSFAFADNFELEK